MILEFYKLKKSALLPDFATKQSACFDFAYHPGITDNAEADIVKVYNVNNQLVERPLGQEQKIIIMPGERALVPTGLIADIPEGYSIRIHPRSSMALKKGLTLVNCEGIIDSDYFNEIFITLHNISDVKVIIEPGMRVAQGELIKNERYEIKETKKKPVQKTNRKGGLGSTGE